MTFNPNGHLHVEGLGLVPILGELDVGCDPGDSDATKITMVYASGHVDVLKPGDNDRRWWAIGTEDVPHNWPGQHLRVLPAIQRTHDATAERHQTDYASDWFHYKTEDGQLAAAAYRHGNRQRQKWNCCLFICDHTGAEWSRSFPAVTDDFGWLVEVPAC